MKPVKKLVSDSSLTLYLNQLWEVVPDKILKQVRQRVEDQVFNGISMHVEELSSNQVLKPVMGQVLRKPNTL